MKGAIHAAGVPCLALETAVRRRDDGADDQHDCAAYEAADELRAVTASANLTRFSGLAATYDAHRPAPPLVLVDILTQLAQVERPRLVVDLGSGTGLSTRLWAERAEQVIGIEPNADMRRQAEAVTSAANVMYRDAVSSQTGLPDGCADIVTVSQALHWMEPTTTVAEVQRILRAGGVFAAYGYRTPFTIHWEIDAAFKRLGEQAAAIEKERELARDMHRWTRQEHLERMTSSGHFRYVNELSFHNIEHGDAERLMGHMLSASTIGNLLKQGLSEREIGFDVFRADVKRVMGDRVMTWHISYLAIVGVK